MTYIGERAWRTQVTYKRHVTQHGQRLAKPLERQRHTAFHCETLDCKYMANRRIVGRAWQTQVTSKRSTRPTAPSTASATSNPLRGSAGLPTSSTDRSGPAGGTACTAMT